MTQVTRAEISKRAKSDLAAIAEYTAEHWGSAQMQVYLDAIHTRMLQLARRPLLGHRRTDLPEEVLSFPIESHVIYYTRTTFGIIVVRVLHKRQDPHRHID